MNAADIESEAARPAGDRYRDRSARLGHDAAALEATDARFGTVRVALFFLTAALWMLGFFATEMTAGFRIAGGVSLVAFLASVILNEPIRDRLHEARRRRAVVRRLIARLERDWDTLGDRELARRLDSLRLETPRRSVAGDLDLFGRASLFQLVSMAATTPGIETLAGWLSGPAVASDAMQRAEAVEALAPRFEDRLRFYTLARDVGLSSGEPGRFVDWATGPAWLAKRRGLVVWANLSAVLAIACVAAWFATAAGVGPFTWRPFAIGLFVLAAVNLTIGAVVLGPAHEIFSIAMASRRAVDEYRELFAAAEWLPEASSSSGAGERKGSERSASAGARKSTGTQSGDGDDRGMLARIRRTLLHGEGNALAAMDDLSRVARAGGLRQSAATFLVYLPLQAFGLWDVRVLRRLERWQASYGERSRVWFETLGEMEALLSLAAVRDEYPDWAMPCWSGRDEPARLEATAIGHPLLREEERVGNDVAVGPPGTFLLITGSNMSGKSTMLRSIGLNVALAAAGGPVCASRFRLPTLEMATSIRVSDDLSQGVSFYMAELHRLKAVVDQAHRVAEADDRVLLFLLDEILQGTNSRERQIAVTQVLRTLASAGAIGAITTHDLELADEPALRDAATTVHFRETIETDADGIERMTFDYRMREGVSPTTNALRLLAMVGLGGGDDDQAAARRSP